jgi:hypothetical protein
MLLGRSVAGKDAVVAHDPTRPTHRGADAALLTEPCPALAVTFADEGCGCECRTDLLADLLVGDARFQALLCGDPQLDFR